MFFNQNKHRSPSPALRIILLIAILSIILSGCAGNNDFVGGNPTETENSDSKTVYDQAQIFNGRINIYQLSRDTFYTFLQTPSRDAFKDSVITNSVFATENPWYMSTNLYRFPIEKELIDFLGNPDRLQAYLLENGVDENIQDMAIFDAPRMPLTLWLKLDSTSAFITIARELEGDTDVYAYQFYSQGDFQEKYMYTSGKIIIRGKEISSDKAIIYHNYADIPLTDVLKAMGAKIVYKYKHNVRIRFNGTVYLLNLDEGTMFAGNDSEQNLLHQIVGGPIFVYRVDDELMVNNSTLAHLLSSMGEEVFVNTDRENNCVRITDKT